MEERHVNIEQPKEAGCCVFLSSSVTIRCPRNRFCDRCLFYGDGIGLGSAFWADTLSAPGNRKRERRRDSERWCTYGRSWQTDGPTGHSDEQERRRRPGPKHSNIANVHGRAEDAEDVDPVSDHLLDRRSHTPQSGMEQRS
ncbi:hypothetical protein AAE478_010460 [Parahypoxylon ruwenzoriense]